MSMPHAAATTRIRGPPGAPVQNQQNSGSALPRRLGTRRYLNRVATLWHGLSKCMDRVIGTAR